jgi:hypothetical protein
MGLTGSKTRVDTSDEIIEKLKQQYVENSMSNTVKDILRNSRIGKYRLSNADFYDTRRLKEAIEANIVYFNGQIKSRKLIPYDMSKEIKQNEADINALTNELMKLNELVENIDKTKRGSDSGRRRRIKSPKKSPRRKRKSRFRRRT